MFSTRVDSIRIEETPITDEDVCSIAERHGADLMMVDLRGSHVSDVALNSLATHATALTTVKLSACHNITDRGFRRLATGCGKTLTHVSLSETRISERCLATFVRRCPQLARLDLSALTCVPGAVFRLPAGYHPYLTTLDLSFCTTLRDAHVAPIVRNCANLTKLNIGWTSLSDQSLATMAKYSHELSELCLMGCKLISDAGICDVIEGCSQLHALDLSWTHISNDSLIAIADHAKNLSTLWLAGCPRLTDEGLHALLRCPTLEAILIQPDGPFSLTARSKVAQARPRLLVYC